MGAGALVYWLWEETRVSEGRGFKSQYEHVLHCKNRIDVCLKKTENKQKAGYGPSKKCCLKQTKKIKNRQGPIPKSLRK